MYAQNYKPSEPGCSMGTAIRNYFKYYATFNGRSSRSEYWFVTLFMNLITIPLMILMAFAAANSTRMKYDYYTGSYYYTENDNAVIVCSVLGIFFCIWGLVNFLPSLGLCIRRLHDCGKSGWFFLLSFIPFLGFIVFIFTLLETEPCVNEYGAVKGRNYPPKQMYVGGIEVVAPPQQGYTPYRQPTDVPANVAEELERYGRLLSQGLLSQEEYNEVKRRLLKI